MRKGGIWRADWFLGLVIALLLLTTINSTFIQRLERGAYDFGVRASDRVPASRIAVIGIDDQSIANIGRWPWSRDVHADMITLLGQSGAKAVGYMSFFFEAQQDPGLAYINQLMRLYQSLEPEAQAELLELGDVLLEAEVTLNSDRMLAASIAQAGNVALPMLFQLGEPFGNPDEALPDYVLANELTEVVDRVGAVDQYYYPNAAMAAAFPRRDIAAGTSSIGHLNTLPEVDGSTRSEALVLRYYDQYYPSFSLMLAAKSLNLAPQDVEVRLGEGVRLGKLFVGTDPYMQMSTYFYKDRDGVPAFQVDSFYDVASGKIAPEKYRDKIVLIGATAAGVGTNQVTPISATMAPVLTLAHTVSSILEEDFFIVPSWGIWAKLGVYLAMSLYIILMLPRLGAGAGAALTIALLAALLGTHYFLMTSQLIWLQLMSSATLLLVGHLALVTKNFIVTERGKVRSDLESAESNRMLGLAFQGQGQLDMAFDKFKKVTLDGQLMDNLYNLGLDFERKRQFNKAQLVYDYMATHDPEFKDLAQRRNRAKQMSETVILGGASSHPGGAMSLGDGVTEKPMLGRYQVERELGKGAMGVVYFGRDPKIGRTVAIKTMALSQEFDADEIDDIKQRFFREAESAGRLNHPHIVTIYDAGEEHDLAYIAMEYLKGKDLVAQTKPGSLLPLPQTISLVERVAQALGYAHQQSVVHRDIKPANIMWDPEADSVKVTDFGIARITDSSRTKTGMVLGTPSYMSPEQLAGKKITGQSDLFSLGVTLYQLACGSLPFQGDSMTQLMFKIANEPPVDVLSINPSIPKSLVTVINRALAKDVASRFATGDEMARALRNCHAEFGTVDVAL